MSGAWMALTAGQMDFWEEFLFHPDQPVSTVAHCLELQGEVDEPALIAAIRQTIAESDTLALAFRDAGGRVEQRVDPARAPQLQQIDPRGHPDPDRQARQLMEADRDAPLDLRRQPVSAQMLLRIGAQRWLWYCRGHHIILDGFGMSLIERRVARLYAAATQGGDAGAPFGRLTDFLTEEAAYSASAACAQDRAYWTNTLTPDRANLPVLRKGAEDYGAMPLRASFTPGPDFETTLQAASTRLGISWADALTLVSALWLTRHDPGRAEAEPGAARPVWLPYMSRMGSRSATIPAMVVNILPLMVDGTDAPAIAIPRLAAQLRHHRRHGRYRIEDMARDCGVPTGQRFYFTPLINVMPFDPPRFAGIAARRHVLAAGPGDGFNVSFTASSAGTGMACAIEADPATQPPAGFTARATGFEHWLRGTLETLARSTKTEGTA